MTAFCRAIETERADAHFRDPFARILAGDRGEKALQRLPAPELTAFACIVRTCLLDGILLQTVCDGAVDVVLNLGAGLDTRPFRLPLPPALRWIELDDPAVLTYKANKLSNHRPACILQHVPLDVLNAQARRQLFRQVCADALRVLILTEGLLIYLTSAEVASLAKDMHQLRRFRWWLSDLVSSDCLSFMEKDMGLSSNGMDNVKLLFAPRSGPVFFHQYGWQTEESRSCLDEAQRLDRWFISKSLASANLASRQHEALRNLFTVVKLKRADLNTQSYHRFLS
jgi:methyltransferase (TIGR00027 family)